jgi:hypothetical protein
MVISGRMACRLRRRIGRANRLTNHHADRTTLGPGDGVCCLFSPTSTYREEAELILLDARQTPSQVLFVCGGACLGLLVASWAESLGRMLARRMLRAACRDSATIGRRDLGGDYEWQALSSTQWTTRVREHRRLCP